ncbi:metal ABC transporter solute-binding protein, Zn/Mn family [Oceanobacillus massiliensis]|uniref:metal ABC transporter solute-binding protein, Zn/Mn family n=1 Tax=Oceanobacillus massiliensis TaxID=1465765 RepID=UPI00301690EA
MQIYKHIILVLLTFILLAGCASANETESEGLEIYTSVYPIEYAVERIAGETATVKTVYPPGVDAHTYEPTTKDMTGIADSDAFIYMGAGMEGFAETAADALASQNVSLIELGQHEELFHTDGGSEHAHETENNHQESEEVASHDEHNHGDHDPHIWIDPLRMTQMAEIIKDELIEINPEDEALYNENFAALEAELHELDENYTEVLEAKENKHILVSHAAYGYWEERYGTEQISINGLSSSNEASQKELTEIIDQAKEYGLEYIIFEQNGSTNVSKIIQQEIGAESLVIHNLSVLTEEDIDNNEDYMSIMNQNLEILDKAMK